MISGMYSPKTRQYRQKIQLEVPIEGTVFLINLKFLGFFELIGVFDFFH